MTTLERPAPFTTEGVLDPAWLSATLSGERPVEVREVRVTGSQRTLMTKLRVEAELADGTTRALCIKAFLDAGGTSSQYWDMAGQAGAAEARFYGDLAPALPMRLAGCHAAVLDPATGHGVVVMDDVVAAGGRFLTALEPYTPDQAAASLEQLAILHTATSSAPVDRFGNRLTQFVERPYLATDVIQGLLDDHRGDALDPAVRSAARLARGLAALAERDAGSRPALVHGDPHAGNLFELGGLPHLIDWQTIQRSHWAIDVSYHIVSALTVEDRERSERDLLRHYLDARRSRGGEAPAWEAAWDDYRAHLLYGYYMWAITRLVAPEIVVEFTRRLGGAVAALGSFELVGV